MPTKILKRFQVNSREMHLLLRELLVYSLGWTDVETNPLGVFEAPLASGVDGETNSAQPSRFVSTSGPFLPGHIGMYLTVYSSEFANVGVYPIIGVVGTDELVLAGGLYGAQFVTDLNVQFRVVDPSLNTAASTNYWVIQALTGSALPLWQTRFVADVGITNRIDFEVSPNAGWAAGWGVVRLVDNSITADATQTWYVLVEDTHIRMWTENTAGTGVFELAYIGAAEPRRGSSDDRFVISLGGDPTVTAVGAIANVSCLDNSLGVQLSYSALTYGDSAQNNMFTSLPASPMDLRNDSARIPLGTEDAGGPEDDRGYLYGFRYISDQLGYKDFVDNGRIILSLGNGLAIEWDGSLSR